MLLDGLQIQVPERGHPVEQPWSVRTRTWPRIFTGDSSQRSVETNASWKAAWYSGRREAGANRAWRSSSSTDAGLKKAAGRASGHQPPKSLRCRRCQYVLPLTLAAPALHYLSPRFHPWQHDNRALLQMWLERNDGDYRNITRTPC